MNTSTAKHKTRRVHLTTRGSSQENDDDEKGRADIDKDKVFGDEREVTSRKAIENTVDDEKANHEHDNLILTGSEGTVLLIFGILERIRKRPRTKLRELELKTHSSNGHRRPNH
jgi:hypothetical protein